MLLKHTYDIFIKNKLVNENNIKIKALLNFEMLKSLLTKLTKWKWEFIWPQKQSIVSMELTKLTTNS